MSETARRLASWALFAVLLLGAPSLAEDLPTAKPEDVGLSSERLARIGERMEQYLGREEMSGALGMVARHGKVVYLETWGDRDREQGLPMTQDTIFRIYSMSKPITSAAVMILYEEGKFRLNDPIGRYIPELADLEVAESATAQEVESSFTSDGTNRPRQRMRPVTIRDLLRHTAGMTYGFFGNSPADQAYREVGLLTTETNLEEFTQKLGKLPLLYEPGTRWHYSVSIDVLGRLVEVTSGQRFGDFLHQRVFEPLGMVDTGFTVPASKVDRFAQLYAPKGSSSGTDAWLTRNDSKEIIVAAPLASRNFKAGSSFQSGGGGLVSTASDYMRFCLAMLNGGILDGNRILSRKSVELMRTNQLGDIQMGMGRSGYGFGYGFAVATDQGRIGEFGSVGEYNWGGAAGTTFWIDPVEQLIGVFMVQIMPHRTNMGSDFRQFTYQSIVD